MAKQVMVLGMMLAVASATANAEQRVEVPTTYEAGHFYATPTLANGQKLRLLVDTGGGGISGWLVLSKAVVGRAGLQTRSCTLDGESFDVVTALDYRPGQGLPVLGSGPCDAPGLVVPYPSLDQVDGQLGAGYLPGHVWTFDYPAQKLWLEPATWQPSSAMHRVALGFPHNDKGEVARGFGRIAARIGDETFQFLLDTGATSHPTQAGKAVEEVAANGVGVTSYITTSQLDHWHRAHPQWRVVTEGDDVMSAKFGSRRLIEVPNLTVGAWTVGPIWFTERPDANFDTAPGHMSSFMDAPIAGALGGNVFQHFRMTIDYPHANAWLACVKGCKAAAQ